MFAKNKMFSQGNGNGLDFFIDSIKSIPSLISFHTFRKETKSYDDLSGRSREKRIKKIDFGGVQMFINIFRKILHWNWMWSGRWLSLLNPVSGCYSTWPMAVSTVRKIIRWPYSPCPVKIHLNLDFAPWSSNLTSRHSVRRSHLRHRSYKLFELDHPHRLSKGKEATNRKALTEKMRERRRTRPLALFIKPKEGQTFAKALSATRWSPKTMEPKCFPCGERIRFEGD